MRFLCDANIGSLIARALIDRGHDVARAIHVVPDADDTIVLAHAVAEQRILVTCDSDFGDLIFGRGAIVPPAVIYIRFEPPDVADIVPRLLRILDFDELRGHMTVIGEIRDRRAPFSTSSNDNG